MKVVEYQVAKIFTIVADGLNHHYLLVKLFTYSCFICRNEKGLLNFVSERIKLVYRINNTRYNFQKKNN